VGLSVGRIIKRCPVHVQTRQREERGDRPPRRPSPPPCAALAHCSNHSCRAGKLRAFGACTPNPSPSLLVDTAAHVSTRLARLQVASRVQGCMYRGGRAPPCTHPHNCLPSCLNFPAQASVNASSAANTSGWQVSIVAIMPSACSTVQPAGSAASRSPARPLPPPPPTTKAPLRPPPRPCRRPRRRRPRCCTCPSAPSA